MDSKGRHQFHSYMHKLMALSPELDSESDSPEHADFLIKNRSWSVRASQKPVALLPPCAETGTLLYDFRFDAKKGAWAPWLDRCVTRRCTGTF